MKTTPNKVTQGIFDAVKICLNSGNNISETATFMKLSWNVVSIISKTETLEEYKAAMYEYNSRKQTQKKAIMAKEQAKEKPEATQVVEHRQTVTVQATHYMEMELKKQTELLTVISNKLAAIIDDLYGVGKGNAVSESMDRL